MRLRGHGLASVYFGIGNTGKPNPSSAFVEVHTDGSVSVFSGAADMGQGSTTTLGQIVAATLGVPLERVAVVTADTGCTPEAGVSSASRQTYMSGNACRLAAEQARDMLMDEAVQPPVLRVAQTTYDSTRGRCSSARSPRPASPSPTWSELPRPWAAGRRRRQLQPPDRRPRIRTTGRACPTRRTRSAAS